MPSQIQEVVDHLSICIVDLFVVARTYMLVTRLPEECTKAIEMVASGISSSAAIVVHGWRAIGIAQSRTEVKELPPKIKETSIIVEKGRLQLSLWD